VHGKVESTRHLRCDYCDRVEGILIAAER